MKRYLGGVAVVALVGGFAVFWHVQSADAPIKHLAAWQRLASPGDLSAAHSRLEGDCGACHTAVKGASHTKCIACHATDERLLTWPELKFHASVRDCRACHPEHLGTSPPPVRMDHVVLAEMGLDLLARGESEVGRSVGQAVLRCATCHGESDAHRGMFGNDCGACHGSSSWVISGYRHPSSASTDCAQCHRPPPCHSTPHFKKVCAPVAGQLNAAVRDCHSCHQVPAWNQIRDVGWYQSH